MRAYVGFLNPPSTTVVHELFWGFPVPYIPKPLLVGGSIHTQLLKGQDRLPKAEEVFAFETFRRRRELVLLGREGLKGETCCPPRIIGLCFFVACRTWFNDICKFKNMAYLWWKVIYVLCIYKYIFIYLYDLQHFNHWERDNTMHFAWTFVT